MEVSLYLGGKSHVSNGCERYLLRSPDLGERLGNSHGSHRDPGAFGPSGAPGRGEALQQLARERLPQLLRGLKGAGAPGLHDLGNWVKNRATPKWTLLNEKKMAKLRGSDPYPSQLGGGQFCWTFQP